MRFEYDAAQVLYEGFDPGGVLPDLGMEPRTPVGARLSPPICRLSVCDSGDRLRPFMSFSGKQIARF